MKTQSSKRWKRFCGLLLLVSALLALSSACSLRYDFTECETDGDCLQIEAPESGQYYQCVQNECVLEEGRECRIEADCDANQDCQSGVCQTINPPEDAGSDADADAGGQDTSDISDVEDEPDAPSTSCTATDECQDRFGGSFYCSPDDECVDTAHENCDPIYYADSDRDDIILLGSIVPTQGAAYQGIGTTIKNGVRMAVIEYASNAFDLPSGHTVAHLHCEGGSSATGKAAAEHMKTIGVPITVGPLTSSTFLEVVRDVASVDEDNDGTFDDPMGAIAIGATSPAIGNLDSAGKHSFQIIANDRFQSSAMVDRANILRWRSCIQDTGDAECTDDSTCQANFGADYLYDDTKPDTPCKDSNPQIAVFYKDDQYGRDLQSLLISRFTDRYSDATFKFYEYADPASLGFDPTRIAQEFGSVISAALSGGDALPTADLVMFIGTGETASLAKGYISALPNQQAALSKRYIFSHGGAADAPNMFDGDSPLGEALMPNVEAVTPNIFNQPYYGKWQQRYSITFSAPAQTSVGGLAYDAAYMGIFAMAGVPSGEALTGTNVTKIIEDGHLQNADTGTEIILEENTSFPGEARQALKDGDDIDMVGVSGGLDFVIESNQNKGTVRSNYLGLDITSRETAGGTTVYEGVPARVYGLAEGQNFGAWCELPCP